MTIKGQIGSISHGTLRSEDLLHAFADELYYLCRDMIVQMADVNATDDATYQAWQTEQNARDKLIEEARTVDPDSDEASEIVNELIDTLNEFAPAYCYFGNTEGDGSDFGFWPSMDAIDELPRISDPNELPTGEDCAFVNDHGNVTVYGADGSVIIELV